MIRFGVFIAEAPIVVFFYLTVVTVLESTCTAETLSEGTVDVQCPK